MNVAAEAQSAIPPRQAQLYRLDEPIRCGAGHKFSEVAGVIPHGWMRCTKRVTDASQRVDLCGEFVYVVHLGGGLLGVARIDWKEAYHVQKLQMSPAQAAEFLQLTWEHGTLATGAQP